MQAKQLIALFTCNLIILIAGNARVALFPLYLEKFNVDETSIGIILSLQFAALAGGTFFGGWFSDRFQKRKEAIFLAGLISVPSLILMAFVDNLTILTILIMIVGFANGVIMLMVSTLTGLFAQADTRGQTFGIIGSTFALGALIGGAIAGPIVDNWSFSVLFIITGLLTIIVPLAAFLLEDKVLVHEPNSVKPSRMRDLGWTFALLFLASSLTYITPYIGSLARPLVMNNLDFSSTAVSSAVAVSGAVSLVLTWLAGWLSDRVERRHLMILCYLANVIGMLILASATQLWQFQMSAAFLLGVNVSLAVGSALVTDIVSPENLGRALSLFSSTAWIGGVAGYSFTGFAIQNQGVNWTFGLGTLFPTIAIVLLIIAFYLRKIPRKKHH